MIQLRVLGRPRRLFYGWVVVAIGFTSQTLNSGLGFQAFGTFLVPLEMEFGWSKTALTSARAFMQIENGLMGPIEGAIIDRFGPRVTMTGACSSSAWGWSSWASSSPYGPITPSS